MRLSRILVGGRYGRLTRNERGAAAVELGLVLPLLILFLFGAIEFGRAWSVRQALVDAGREGARVAAVGNSITPQATLQALVISIVRQRVATAQLDTTMLTVTPTGVGAGVNTPVTVLVEYKYSPITGRLILRNGAVNMRTTSVMRNE
jgi:Flp pilus assembly protein TadG